MSDNPQDTIFDKMYNRMDDRKTPEKVSGQPVSRSSREFLEQLRKQDEQS